MKKIKQGGVLGRNLKHAQKIKTFAMGALALMAIMLVSTFVDAGISSLFGTQLAAGGLSLCALPIFLIEGKFKELTGADWETFKKDATPEQLAEYFNSKNEAKRKELELLIESKSTDSAKAIEVLKESLKSDMIEQMKSLNDVLKSHGLMIKKLSEREKEAKAFQIDSIAKGLADNIEKLKGLRETDRSTVETSQFSFKAVGDMTIAGNISGGNVPVEQRIEGMNAIASRRLRLFDIMSRGTAQSNVISWVYQANREGAAGTTVEGATKNQIDFDLIVASETVSKLSAYIKVSTEMMEDIDFIKSEINNELIFQLMKAIEVQAYSGNGTLPNLRGVRTVATAFSAGVFAGTVDNANLVDVLRVAMNQIAIADQEPANFILLHPSDVTKLMLIKTSTTDRRYIDALQMIAGQLSLDGVPIIKTTLVTAGEYLVGNFGLATMYDKGSVTINVGLDGNDFTKNMRTILAEWRGLVIVKNNDRTAFVKGVIATDAAVLETP